MKVKRRVGGVKPKRRSNAKKNAGSSKKLQNRKTTDLVAATAVSNDAVEIVPPPILALPSAPPAIAIPPVRPITSKEAREIIRSDPTALEIFRDLYPKSSGRNVVAWTLKPDDPAYTDIHTYIANSQEHGFGIKILSILRVISKAHLQKSFRDPPPLLNSATGAPKSNRLMLWHGTIKSNIGSILQNGFRLPVFNYQMFGAGIYFSDRASKSCQYSMMNASTPRYLLLCDVQLGNVYRTYRAFPTLRFPPFAEDFDSVQGVGSWIPDSVENKTVQDCVWPLGRSVQNIDSPIREYLNFNEYVVYTRNRVTPKYLVKIEITEEV